MINTLIWDMGGVLVSIDDLTPRRAWEERLGLKLYELDDIVLKHPLANDVLSGSADLNDMWKAIASKLRLTASEALELSVDFWGGTTWNKKLFSFIKSTKDTYRHAVLSNAWIDTREAVKEWINEDLFDVIMFSAEEGICKPDARIYRRALSRLSVEPMASVMVDDRLENVRGAQAVGIFGIHYTPKTDILKAIYKCGEPNKKINNH